MLREIKAGDWVKVKESGYNWLNEEYLYQWFEVKEVFDNIVKLDMRNTTYFTMSATFSFQKKNVVDVMSAEEFKELKTKEQSEEKKEGKEMFTLKDLEVGMVIEIECGDLLVITDTSDGLLGIDLEDNSTLDFDGFTEDMRFGNRTDLRIDKVYSKPDLWSDYINTDLTRRTLLFDRNKEEKTEEKVSMFYLMHGDKYLNFDVSEDKFFLNTRFEVDEFITEFPEEEVDAIFSEPIVGDLLSDILEIKEIDAISKRELHERRRKVLNEYSKPAELEELMQFFEMLKEED